MRLSHSACCWTLLTSLEGAGFRQISWPWQFQHVVNHFDVRAVHCANGYECGSSVGSVGVHAVAMRPAA